MYERNYGLIIDDCTSVLGLVIVFECVALGYGVVSCFERDVYLVDVQASVHGRGAHVVLCGRASLVYDSGLSLGFCDHAFLGNFVRSVEGVYSFRLRDLFFNVCGRCVLVG